MLFIGTQFSILYTSMYSFLKVYMELGSYFLFLQEQIKDIIICRRSDRFRIMLVMSCGHLV